MERPAEYGTKKFATCEKCSWTGPLEYFDRQADLLNSKITLNCPKCGGKSPFKSSTFTKEPGFFPKNMTIISGGQTGVDRGALDAAIERGIPHRGWCPKGRKAEDGTIALKYNMQEMNDWQYWKRTEKNVLDSDGTLVFPGSCKSKGTALTIRLARKLGKPIAVIPLDSPDATQTVRAWIAAHNIKNINIAGPRESGAPGIGKKTFEFLINL